MKKSIMERLKELKDFSIDVKRLCRNSGRSRRIDVSEFEELFVRYDINLNDWEWELEHIQNDIIGENGDN